jgi:hypothetical protein
MKANTRQVAGSTRSGRTPLSQSATGIWRFSGSGKSTYKTQTKCIQNHECDFFTTSVPTTSNFNTVKCLNFPVHYSSQSRAPLAATKAYGLRTLVMGQRRPFSLGEKVRMRDKLVPCVLALPTRFEHCISPGVDTEQDQIECRPPSQIMLT